jgi:hypothetical protein
MLSRRTIAASFISAAVAFACAPADMEGSPLEGDQVQDQNPTGPASPTSCTAAIKGEDPNLFPKCSGPKGGNGRCVPKAAIGIFADQFVDGGCAAGNVCVAENLVKTGTSVELKKCKPVLGQSTEDGRCFSTLAKDVVANYDLLKNATGDQCADAEVCVPCKNPLKGNVETGVCFKAQAAGSCTNTPAPAGDGGTGAPSNVACPYNGPPLVNVSTFPVEACGAGMRCVPSNLLPSPDLVKNLKACSNGGVCAPEKSIAAAGNYVPKTCTSVAGAEGRCTNENIPAIQAQKSMLPKDSCDVNEVCAPCYNPLDSTATGACSTAKCDAPKLPPKTFTACCNARAKCVPKTTVPEQMQKNLGDGDGTCQKDVEVCVPNEFVSNPAYKGTPCTGSGFIGGQYDGVCLSDCLEFSFFQSLGISRGNCASQMKCVPCQNPLTGQATGAPGCPGT